MSLIKSLRPLLVRSRRRRFSLTLVGLSLLFLLIWWGFDWLTTPGTAIALFLLGLSSLPWLIRASRKYRRLSILPIVLLSGYLIATAPPTLALATQGLVFVLPQDQGGAVDAIVVLGRGPDYRTSRAELAAQLWQEHRAPRIFASGMSDAREMVRFITELGLPQQAVEGEACSQNTEENALFTSALLYPQGVRNILLITDPPHMLRSLLLFHSFGFTVTPKPSPLPAEWSAAKKSALLLREYGSLIVYKMQKRFQPRSLDSLQQPPAQVLSKIKDWNCQIIVSDSDRG
jgi:uncharacterized SAM-binding protein YcdF (DUF218 family)